jgi:hypothetical protein
MRLSSVTVIFSCCLLLAGSAAAQTDTPKVHFRGFADINFADTSNDLSDDTKSHDGFSLGNLVGHVSASLGGKFSFFGEVNVTGVDNQFSIDVARAFIRYDYNDRLKISGGRYHAPIGYWNVAFHRGLWLQTTIFRPDIIREEWFQPDHFLGVIAEGHLVSRIGLGYIAGYGNGRDSDLGPSGLDAGDIDGEDVAVPGKVSTGRHRAGVVRIFSRPPQFNGVEFGGAVYHDQLAVAFTNGVPELITSAYLAITRESPEILAEFSNLRHSDYYTDGRSRNSWNSQAFYVQFAYRIPQQAKWKPYTRFEKSLTPKDEPVTGNLENSKLTAGIRYELTDFATLKVEYGQRRKPGTEHVNGVFAQTAFTF